MFRVTVLYGNPTDPAAFEQYYREKHFPLAAKMQGVRGCTISRVASPDPTRQAPYYRIATFYFEKAEAFRATFASPEGKATVADLQNFATGGVTLLVGEEEVMMPVTLARE